MVGWHSFSAHRYNTHWNKKHERVGVNRGRSGHDRNVSAVPATCGTTCQHYSRTTRTLLAISHDRHCHATTHLRIKCFQDPGECIRSDTARETPEFLSSSGAARS